LVEELSLLTNQSEYQDERNSMSQQHTPFAILYISQGLQKPGPLSRMLSEIVLDRHQFDTIKENRNYFWYV
jgi:hypothetical protein